MHTQIRTARLQLTPIAESETAALHQLLIRPSVRRYLCDDQIILLQQVQQMVVQSIAAFTNQQYGLWVARFNNSGEIIGFTGYWPFFEPPQVQLVYGLSDHYWGIGLATEMAKAMLSYGFQTYGWETIYASTDAPNTASIAVMQRLGMHFEKPATLEGKDLIFYQIHHRKT